VLSTPKPGYVDLSFADGQLQNLLRDLSHFKIIDYKLASLCDALLNLWPTAQQFF
jgi:hypothetical protein